MCGISGIMYMNSGQDALANIGGDLVKMLDSLSHRGRDSTGFTVVGGQNGDHLIVRLWMDDPADANLVLSKVEESVVALGGSIASKDASNAFIRLTIDYQGEAQRLAEALMNTDGVVIHSIGRASEVIKDVGVASDVDHKLRVSQMLGTHGIGHVRMATESKVDITHSHPFWAYPFTDVTVVHNGQLTNYHKLKRHYQSMGHHFLTENDSELIAVYLADKLADGHPLESVLTQSLDDLDGTFTYLVSTRYGMGVAKDRWAAKPLVTMQTDDVVAVASEEIALRSVFTDEELDRVEPQESEVLTWSV